MGQIIIIYKATLVRIAYKYKCFLHDRCENSNGLLVNKQTLSSTGCYIEECTSRVAAKASAIPYTAIPTTGIRKRGV